MLVHKALGSHLFSTEIVHSLMSEKTKNACNPNYYTGKIKMFEEGKALSSVKVKLWLCAKKVIFKSSPRVNIEVLYGSLSLGTKSCGLSIKMNSAVLLHGTFYIVCSPNF